MLIFANQSIVLHNSDIMITSSDLEVINELIIQSNIVDIFPDLKQFNLENYAQAMNTMLMRIPQEQHNNIYKNLIEYLHHKFIDIKHVNKDIIMLLFFAPFVLKHYGEQMGHISYMKKYYYSNQSQNIVYILINNKGDKIYSQDSKFAYYNSQQVIWIGGISYKIHGTINKSDKQNAYLIYTGMVKNTSSYALGDIKSRLYNYNPEYIIDAIQNYLSSQLTSVQKTLLLETDVSPQSQNDLYCLQSMYSHLIYIQYTDNEYRIIVPMITYKANITHNLPNVSIPLSLLYNK